MKFNNSTWLLFFLILFTGIFLRAFNWQEIPFTHDEYSALFRTGFSDLGNFIAHGIKPDVHPALIQFFLNYWVALVGKNPLWFKLPFLIMGIASIYLVFRIGAYWFNTTVGLFAAVFIATLQHPVMYSQIARPYISGLFFTLFAFWQLSLFLWSEKHQNWHYAGWILGAILCCYNHYFSLLTIFFIGTTSILLVERSKMLKFLISGLIIILAFIPHLPITLHHLNTGGLAWLGEPGWDFPWQFLKYSFHFSYWVLGLFIGLGIIGLVYKFLDKQESNISAYKNRFRYLALGWFLFPLIVGFYYSIYFKPVLEYSGLLFAFPFLLLFVLSFIPNLTIPFRTGFIVLIIGLNTFTLIGKRQHYEVFYESRYNETFNEAKSDIQRYGAQNLNLIFNCNPNITNFWKPKMNFPGNTSFYLKDRFSIKEFQTFLDTTRKKFISFVSTEGMDWRYFKLAHEQYPFILKSKNYYLGRYFLMAREPHPDTVNPYVASQSLTFENYDTTQTDSLTNITTKEVIQGKVAFEIPEGEAYSPVLEARLDTILATPNDVILASAYIYKKDTSSRAMLTMDIKTKKGRMIKWESSHPLVPAENAEGWKRAMVSINLTNKNFDPESTFVRVSVWDPKKAGNYADNLKFQVIRGNLIQYGLYYPIPEPY